MRQFINKLLKSTILVPVILLGMQINSIGCSTPVFRYALEMWPAYSYVIEIAHDGNLNSAQQQAFDFLKNSVSPESSANLIIKEKVQTNGSEGAMIKLTFPDQHKILGAIWTGPLTMENAKKIINSPSRKAALEKIRRGDAVVWLFLESGNVIRDEKQYNLLTTELTRLSKELKLSETATDVAGNLLDIKVVNTGVNFSLVRIDRDDPTEEVFIEMLLGTESDLRYFENVPLAFPMFGQGRILYALAGNGIKSKNIETACSTLIGWCSCTIKDDNPGTDLLFAADWEIFIGDSSWIIPVEVPEITGLSAFLEEDMQIEDVKNEIPIGEVPTPELNEEERLGTEVIDSPDSVEKEPEIALVPVVVNNEVLNSSSESNQKAQISPLLRNSMIVFVLILVLLITTLFIMKRT